MRTNNRGFLAFPVLLALGIILIAGGALWYTHMHTAPQTQQPVSQPVVNQQTITTQNSPSRTTTGDSKVLSLIPLPEGVSNGDDFNYYKNSENVYIVWPYGSTTQIEGADPGTFTIDIPSNSFARYAIDNHAVYDMGKQVFTLATPGTQFHILSPGRETNECAFRAYVMITNADNSNSIYYGDEPIVGADAKTFTVLDMGYAKDAHHVYEGTTTSAYDPTTFNVQALGLCQG